MKSSRILHNAHIKIAHSSCVVIEPSDDEPMSFRHRRGPCAAIGAHSIAVIHVRS